VLNPLYKTVKLLSSAMPPSHPEVVGLALQVPGSAPADAFRFHLSPDEAERIALALLNSVAIQRYRATVREFHSYRASGNPSSDGSPQTGQPECPETSCSSADSAESNGPSKQSSSSHSIQPRGT